jgi:DNA-binding transcriptional ArsR family regulator
VGITKSNLFDEDVNQIAQLCKAMGHPARIAIIHHLLDQKSCICNDLVTALPLSQPTISQHLKALKEAGIIQGEVEGASMCYCIAPKALIAIQTYFNQLVNQLNAIDTSCC